MTTPVTDRAAAVLDALPRAGCTCMTKTPELRYHREDCSYRRFAESLFLAQPASEVASVEAASPKNVAESPAD